MEEIKMGISQPQVWHPPFLRMFVDLGGWRSCLLARWRKLVLTHEVEEGLGQRKSLQVM